jgi:glycosyltransferase involved in cell wall biosynthesis
MTSQPVSVVLTVLNEAGSLDELLRSLEAQSRRPNEIVVVDGGSTDGTWESLQAWEPPGVRLIRLRRPGANISRGRNEAIRAAEGPIVAVTDAGVRLDSTWLAELSAPFEAAEPPDVVSGFFVADPRSVFERALGATTLPTRQEIDAATFLPSSRSVAFSKNAWEGVGGYPEWLDYCEDLVFDLALRDAGRRFRFAPNALVYFRPRSNLRQFFTQYYRYARGDGKADLWRRRHAIRYGTYIGAGTLLALSRRQPLALVPLLFGGLAYCRQPWRRLWSTRKDLAPLDQAAAVALVPLLRLIGDLAKMLGYPAGLAWRLRRMAGEHRAMQSPAGSGAPRLSIGEDAS